MNQPSTLQRIVAAIASVCTTFLLLAAVVSLSEPAESASGTQIANAAPPTGSAQR